MKREKSSHFWGGVGGSWEDFLGYLGFFFSNGKSQIFIIFSAGWLDFI